MQFGRGHGNETFWMILVLMLIVIAWAIFFWRLTKWLRRVADGHEHLCLQVAELDAYAGGIRTDCDQMIRNSERLRQNMIRLPGWKINKRWCQTVQTLFTMLWWKWEDM
jgi:hypothetical protein